MLVLLYACMQVYAYIYEVEIMRETLKAFKVLTDETRFRILNLLLERECCVCEIEQALEISQSKASRGLTALYDAGFLQQRKDGLWSLYSMDKAINTDYRGQLVAAVQESGRQNPQMAEDRERLQQAIRTSPRCSGANTPCAVGN